MIDVAQVRGRLSQAVRDLDLDGCCLVTGVYTARRALIMDSNSQSAEMVVEDQVEGLQTSTFANINAQASIWVTQHKDAAFIKD